MLFLYFVLVTVTCLQVLGDPLNDRPIIGILTQELSDDLNNKYPGYKSFVGASYVKFVEEGGARVVPIMINQPQSYYENMVNSINGVLFPGRSAKISSANGYGDAGRSLYDLALKKNQKGDYFPVWGTSLGFEFLSYFASNGINALTSCLAENMALPLEFTTGFNTSRLFMRAPYNLWDGMKTINVTVFFNKLCLTPQNFTSAGMDKDWRIVTTNDGLKGLTFVSTFEHKKYPFYGVQFHPEKNAYEWKITQNNPHTFYGILIAQYFSNFLVNEARNSNSKFPTKEAEQKALIYNFNVTYTALQDTNYEQIYFF